MVFGRGYRRRTGRSKPAMLTTNHCRITAITTVGGTESQQSTFTTIEPPTNRGAHIPASAMLKYVSIELWAVDTTPVSGKHACMMFYQPGGTTITNPITNWLSTADPLGDAAIRIRQQRMTRFKQFVTISGASQPPYHRCVWKGNISLRDGDDIQLVLLDDNATSWEGICTAAWIA